MLTSAYGKHGRLEGAAGAPVMTVDKPMYQVCHILGQIQASILPNSNLKIDHAKVQCSHLSGASHEKLACYLPLLSQFAQLNQYLCSDCCVAKF